MIGLRKLLGTMCLLVLLFSESVISANAQTQAVQDTGDAYSLYVNKAQNVVTVKQADENGEEVPVKVMIASCGREGHETPEGTFKTSNYYNWRLMVDNTYGRYAVRFNNKILFHSVPYMKASPDTLEWEEYNKLGESASLGCVRLAAVDAKWIFDNCKAGTKVVVYSDEAETIELDIPEPIKIDVNSPNRNWDPTDISLSNPWFDALGSIEDFNYMDYANRYKDLKEIFGYDQTALYSHYIQFGIMEGRKAEFSSVEAAK